MKVAVVGAGPAGLAFAAKYGDADIYEEHQEIGLPRHCTSLVGGRSARLAGIPQKLVVNKFEELLITDLEGRRIRFRIRDKVYLIDRPGLEQWLAEKTRNVALGKRVVAVRDGYVYTSDGTRRGPYDYVVIAEGFARRLSSAYGHVVRLPALQIDVRSDVELPGITVVYNQKLSRAYFSWIVKIDKGLYRVGLADVCCTVERLRKLVKLVRGIPIGKPFGGGVLAGPPLRRVVEGKIILIGDAAGLVKPLSGGGIVLALRSGYAAAEALAESQPHRYEEETLAARLRLRAAFAAFRLLYGQRLVDRLLKILDGGEYVAVDYDDHLKTLATAALTDPRALRALGEVLSYLTSNRNALHLF